MKMFNKIMKGFIALLMVITSIDFNSIKLDILAKGNDLEFPVIEDAYIRSGNNGDKNYSFENIVKEHGEQYEGKNFKVLNVKYNGNSEIISVMKYKLPTKEEIKNKDINKFEYLFNIFKNPNPNEGTQIYNFYYTLDCGWNEESITWNNKPNSIKHIGDDLLFKFEINKGTEYEFKTDKEKQVKVDITDKIIDLISQNVKEITVYACASNNLNTSLMIHDRTSGMNNALNNGDKVSKIIASDSGIRLNDLQQLIIECEKIDKTKYTYDSYMNFQKVLNSVKTFANQNPVDNMQIYSNYKKLKTAKDGLILNIDKDDELNIAYKKPTRSNLNQKESANVTDGDITTYWKGKFFPSYVDIDLMDTYSIKDIEMYLKPGKVQYYTLYGSNDGKKFDEIHKSRNNEKKTVKPDIISFEKETKYRIIRVYLEYTENDPNAYLSEIKVHGIKQNNNTSELRKGTFEEITGLKDYDEEYKESITEKETIDNVYGIIDRTIGSKYRNWFSFEIAPNKKNNNDYFELSTKDGKIHIKGNEGISLTTGLNYYYKNYVNVQISEQTMQVDMPEKIVLLDNVVRKETPLKTRYAFNYCTLSYTFAFYGEEEWQRENDWLALNGVNVVLDLAGQEATWIKFLMDSGYSFDEAKDWLVGPGYYAWQFMDNMEVFGGPIPDDYVIDRVKLARKTQRWKNSLGMQTVLQGYAGMVPTNFKDYYKKEINLIEQGNWNGFSRPTMIATDSKEYDELSTKFYDAQKFVYGDTTDYYAVDPFHEGGKRPSGLSDDKIAKEVLESMLSYDKDAVWIVQGWQSNPTSGLLNGMGENKDDHVLVVDLIKYPLTGSEAQYKTNEFNGTSWAWCLLGNFGGNPSMNGQIETMVDEIMEAKATKKHMKGIGIISEATNDNPMIYDLIFDLAWADQDFNLDNWIKGYLRRRYGGDITNNVISAWNLIKKSNYSEGVRLTKQLFDIRNGGVPRKIGKFTIGYSINDLENALRLLMKDYEKYQNSEGYRYDISEIMRQVVSNYSLYKYHDVIDARDSKDIEKFRIAKKEFLNSFDILNEVAKTQKDQLTGEWIGKAQDRAKTYDDFSKSVFEMNAKSLISTWGSVGGALIDYGFRTYEGSFLDLRKSNWIEYLDQVEANMLNGSPITVPSNAPGYAQKYWKWVIGEQEYTRTVEDSAQNVQSVANKVLAECVFSGDLDPNIGNLALNRKVIVNGDENYANSKIVTDGKLDKILHVPSYMNGNKQTNPELVIDLLAEFNLTKLQLVLDSSKNKYYNYELYVSSNGNQWTKVGEKKDSSVSNEKGDIYSDLKANGRFVKIVGKSSGSSQIDKNPELNIIEVRTYGNEILPNLEQLRSLIEVAKSLDTSNTTEVLIKELNRAIKEATDAYNSSAAPDTVNVVYWNLYNVMNKININEEKNIAIGKTTIGHNDPAGHSEYINDGNLNTFWDGGRLSATGKPYEDKITEGWVMIDLKELHDINKVKVIFNNSNIWHQYEIYTSIDKENWEKIGEKKTQSKPNEKEDVYEFKNIRSRYIKFKATNIQTEANNRRSAYHVSELQIFGREVKLNKEKLNQAIQTADKKIQNDEILKYTKDSWAKFIEKYKEAKDINQNELVSQNDINLAESNLNSAINDLILRGKTEKLQNLLTQYNQLNESNYTEKSWNTFEKNMKIAKNAVLDNSNLSQKDIDKVYDDLCKAKEGLVLKEIINKKELLDLINKLPEKEEIAYTSASWKAYEEALEKANKVLANEKATQKEIDDATKALQDAYAKLKENPGLTPIGPSEQVIPMTPLKPSTPVDSTEKPSTTDKVENGEKPNTGVSTNTYLLWIMVLGTVVILLETKKRKQKDN